MGVIAMGMETMETYNTLQLIGNTDTLGTAWHFRAEDQGDEPNHYPGAIPVEDVRRRLLNWQAEWAPMEYTVPERISLDGVTPAQRMTDDTRKVVFRSDTGQVMGVFSMGYEIHQHDDEVLDGTTSIIGDALGISSAGLLAGGAVFYVQVSRADSVILADGAEYKPYLLGMGSHNGQRATGWQWAVQRVLCDNTLTIAAAEKGTKFKIKHTRYSKARIKDAREALGILDTGTGAFAEEMQEFLALTVDDVQWQKFLDAFVPVEDGATKRSQSMADTKRGELNRLYKYDERVAPWKGNAWGVYQAVNTFDQHHAIARGLGDGNQAQARYARSLMAASGGDLDKQFVGVKQALASVL